MLTAVFHVKHCAPRQEPWVRWPSAREHYNLSEWGKLKPEDADHTLDEICEEVEEGAMPLASYRWMHAQARLSEQDVQAICAWTQAERRRLAETAGGGNTSEESHDEEGSPTHSH